MKRQFHFGEEKQRNDPQFSPVSRRLTSGNGGNEADFDDGPGRQHDANTKTATAKAAAVFFVYFHFLIIMVKSHGR